MLSVRIVNSAGTPGYSEAVQCALFSSFVMI